MFIGGDLTDLQNLGYVEIQNAHYNVGIQTCSIE